jgi:hypothetical protein
MHNQVKLMDAFSLKNLGKDINVLAPEDWVVQGNVSAIVIGAVTLYIATMVRPEGYLPPEQRKVIAEQQAELWRLYTEAETASDRVDAAIIDDSDGYGGICFGKKYDEAQAEFASTINAISVFKQEMIQPEK